MSDAARASTSPAISLPAACARSLLPVVGCIGFALLMHLAIARVVSDFHIKLLLDIGINIILAVSLNMVNGFTGQFSIGHAGFMAIGGYTAAAMTYYGGGSIVLWGQDALDAGLLSTQSTRLADFEGALIAGGDWLFVAACLVGGLVAALLGFAVGLPSLRLRGDYLAIVTLGFGEIVRVLLEQSKAQLLTRREVEATPVLERFTHLGGALGITRVPFYTTLFWVFLFASVTVLVAFRLRMSSHGRAFLSIREDAIASEAMGVPITRYKVVAFVFAAFFAGIAGSLFAHQVGSQLNPGELGFIKSFDILIMVVLGGLGSISGSIVAAILLTLLPELLRDPPHFWPMMLVVIATVLIAAQIRKGHWTRGLRAAGVLLGITVIIEIIRAVAVHYGVDLSRYRMILYALSLILMMVLRPQGLFGLSEIWDVIPWPRRVAKSGVPA